MADITSLLPVVAPTVGDIVYGATDPGGTPADAVFDVAQFMQGTVSLTAPPVAASGWSWDNQDSATIADASGGGLWMTLPLTGGNSQVHMYYRSTPAAPYDIVMAVRGIIVAPANFSILGVGWRESGSGSLITVATQGQSDSNGTRMSIDKWTSSTSFSGNVSTLISSVISPLIWVRLVDTSGTTNLRECHLSTDGENWVQIYSEARTTFITADQFGIFVYSANSGAALGLQLVSLST